MAVRMARARYHRNSWATRQGSFQLAWKNGPGTGNSSPESCGRSKHIMNMQCKVSNVTLQKYQILGKVPGNPGALSFRSDQLDLNQILGVSVLPFIHLFNFLNFCISVCLNGNGHASIWKKKEVYGVAFVWPSKDKSYTSTLKSIHKIGRNKSLLWCIQVW